MNSILLYTLAILLLFKNLTAMEVKFGENDYIVNENDESLTVPIIASQDIQENVTIELIPMTLYQFSATGTSLPDNAANQDPAEADLDFDSSVHTVTFHRGITSISVNIPIFQDQISENEEVFLLVLRISEDTPDHLRRELQLKKNVSTARIKSFNRVTIALSKTELFIYEGNETISDQLFIEIDGQIEPNVSVKLTLTKEKKIYLLQHDIPISYNDSRRIPVPLHVIDDAIAGETISVTLSLKRDYKYISLYSTSSTKKTANIFVLDDDIPIVGFEVENETANSVKVMEGETKEVCVSQFKPQENNMPIEVTVQHSPNIPQDVISFERQRFYIHQTETKHCFDLVTLENARINHPVSINMTISFQVLGLYPYGNEVLVEPSLLQLIITDDDGIPPQPSNLRFHYDGQLLKVSWEANVSELQPVKRFVITVKAMSAHTIVRSRRQENVSILPEDYWEYKTEQTSFTFKEMDLSRSYNISVCAENDVGRTCTEAMQFTSKSEPLNPKHQGLNERKPSNKNTGLSLSVPIMVAIIVSVVIVLLLFVLILCVVAICKCTSNERNYYPSKQEKAVLGTVSDADANKYYRCYSSNSSVSLEWKWTTAIPSSNTMPPKKIPSINPCLLGTSV